METESQVEVVIEGDGRELFRGTTSRRDPPKPLALDVKGCASARQRPQPACSTSPQVNLVDAKVSK